MNPEWVRELCLSLPGATEHVIWGSDLTFKVAGRMFTHTVLEPAPVWLSFKTAPEQFYELTERQSIVPAPYMARAQWVALQTRDALSGEELAALIRNSYELVVARLPKKTRAALARGETIKVPPPRKKSSAKTVAKKKQTPKRAGKKRALTKRGSRD